MIGRILLLAVAAFGGFVADSGSHVPVRPAAASGLAASPGNGLRPLVGSRAALGRALILEPFASQLNMGPHAGDAVAEALMEGGYTVTQLYDNAVTLNTMATLSQYNIVYMQTHTGVNKDTGEAVVASGQVADVQTGGPAVSPDYQTMTVNVEGGGNTLYDGVMSGYIRTHEGQFPHDALIFINGCDFLDGKQFWNALAAKGVGAVVSWDSWTDPLQVNTAAQLFFGYMDQGMTVASAVEAVKAAGYGVSTTPGEPPAHIGYLGDGSLTLRRQLQQPTSTPAPPTATPTPTPVRLPTVPPPSLGVKLRSQVAAGSRQLIQVSSSPNAIVRFRVEYPNGDHQSASRVADAGGTVNYSYIQGSSKIRHGGTDALVRIVADNGSAAATLVRTYRILYGPIDLSAEPRQQVAGKPLTIWLHTWPRTFATVQLAGENGAVARFRMHTGPHGWAHRAYAIPQSLTGTVQVSAAVTRGKHVYRTQTRFSVTS